MAVLTAAIENRKTVRVLYRGEERTIAPYALGRTRSGELMVHGYKTEGGGATPGAHWANLKIGAIESAEENGTYDEPMEGYNPEGKIFAEVLLATARGPLP